MTREEIIHMAREAGMTTAVVLPDLERFAHLLLADFLESTGQYVTNDASREAVIAQAVAAEREACAQIVERNAAACDNNAMLRDVLMSNAAAIRQRDKIISTLDAA